MRYFTRAHGSDEISEISREDARIKLDGVYTPKFVDDIIGNEKPFRLQTPYRDVWTKSENGMTPMPGFYGVIE